MNELHLESSPYLLQHATNPVFWKGWNQKSLDTAVLTNKLIIVSVGYAACHWCHVMEHESFEDTEVATVMNKDFIAIKVDREERPDVDAVYMKAVQIMTSRGGWPLNVVCLPNGKPVWGGTYFRKEEWIDYLIQLQDLYSKNPEKLIEYADKLHEGLQQLSVISNDNPNTEFNFEAIELLIQKWQKSFDLEFGGMARAPKFMMPTNYNFLLNYGYVTQNNTLLDFVNLTLTKMAYGGIFDTVDGGFSRYSVDFKWHIPHFEKMLYDNGQLVSLYSNAYKLTKNILYKQVVEKTLLFVEKELFSPEFGFYASLDADSINHENHLEEGAFYVWKITELKEIIKQDFNLFSEVFNVNDFGFWENGNYVLIQNKSLREIASQNSISELDLQNKKTEWEEILHFEREKRAKPRLDDKCLCSWNAIMLKGFIDAYKAFGTEKYLEIALQNGNFILQKFLLESGNLYHNYKHNKATINGYLEDYCFTIEAFIGLYQITLDENWLQTAKQLVDYCLDNFYDAKTHFFRFTSIKDDELITTHFELEDNVIPASNSVMASNLLALSTYFDFTYYEEIAQKMILNIIPNIDYASAYSNWLNASLYFLNLNNEIAICGNNVSQDLKKWNSLFLPNTVIAGTSKVSQLPFLKNRFSKNENLYYLCQNRICQLPFKKIEEVIDYILK
ncbi:MAG: thioredoxin domain-containing protein [Flavobacterium sp.]|nr:thioredoxin domain-containing protein [Flavobacterium sp.]